MTRTRWIIFAAIVLLILSGLVVLSGKDKVDVNTVDANALITSGDNADNIYGNANAKVIVIEYADFQCPGCAGAYAQMNTIKEIYKNDVAFVFRNFPLTTIHPNALASSSAAEAAGLQGKFWEMHDLLFANQSNWESLSTSDRGPTFEGFASQLNLDLDQFKTDIASERVANRINFHRALGGKANVTSTPTLFINGNMVSSETINDIIQKNGDLFKKELDSAIKTTGGTVPANSSSTN